MEKNPDFDTTLAHRYFSADCFNKAWELIEKSNRTREENERMILLAQSSLWHWTNRSDCKEKQLSIGHWLLARVQALAGRPEEARRHAELCLQHSQGRRRFLPRMRMKPSPVPKRWLATRASWRNTRRKPFDLRRPSKTLRIENC